VTDLTERAAPAVTNLSFDDALAEIQKTVGEEALRTVTVRLTPTPIPVCAERAALVRS
jgi:hypothetical protein